MLMNCHIIIMYFTVLVHDDHVTVVTHDIHVLKYTGV